MDDENTMDSQMDEDEPMEAKTIQVQLYNILLFYLIF